MEFFIALFLGIWLFVCGYISYKKLKKEISEQQGAEK